jgi:integrase
LSTIEDKQITLRLHVLPAFGSLRLDQIHRRDVDQYIMSKSKGGRSMNSILKDISILHQMMTLAHDHGLIAQMPKFKLPPLKPSEVVSLSPEEAQRFLDAAAKRSQRDATLFELYLRTGMRCGEAIALHPCDFDLDAEQPVVIVRKGYSRGRLGKTKGRNVRVIPLPPSLAKKVAELIHKRGLSPNSETEYVFSPRGNVRKPLNNRCVHRKVRALGEAAGLDDLHPHKLRHTFGTECARRGVPPVTIKEWMGHRKLDTTMVYVHLVTPDHLRWAKLLGD